VWHGRKAPQTRPAEARAAWGGFRSGSRTTRSIITSGIRCLVKAGDARRSVSAPFILFVRQRNIGCTASTSSSASWTGRPGASHRVSSDAGGKGLSDAITRHHPRSSDSAERTQPVGSKHPLIMCPAERDGHPVESDITVARKGRDAEGRPALPNFPVRQESRGRERASFLVQGSPRPSFRNPLPSLTSVE
jgi:hypothetical protein